MKIVVIGGTGLIGSKVVARLAEQGHEAVAASPKTGVNTLTGEGLAEALSGTQVVVDVANSPSFEAAEVMRFFETSTGNLLTAEAAEGVGHHVALSIVGTGRTPTNDYFLAKRTQEQLIEKSGLPYSIVHATQFFEFVRGIADESTQDGLVRIAPVLFQPIAGDDVAEAVARVAVGTPLNGGVEVAGPEQFRMDEFFREALASSATRARSSPTRTRATSGPR
ncbi:SDR family oxidoreductase [Nonomuraea rubra]|uniref:SDR family oxidoreductase n=1 Tax=Nonomuraea rubra TaxID=46180 RepID=UPI00360A2115